jgi:hypothetical protein
MTCDEIAAIFEPHGMTLLGPPLSLVIPACVTDRRR